MTISSTTNRYSYTGSGTTGPFAFSSAFQAKADLVLVKTLISTGAQTVLVLTTDYTIPDEVVSGGGWPTGANITLVASLSSSYTLTIYRDPARTQSTRFTENDPLPVKEIEKALDKLTLLLQRAYELYGRGIVLPDGFTSTFNLNLPALLPANYILAVNAAGDGLTVLNGVAAGTATVTAYTGAFLLSVDAAAARTALGLGTAAVMTGPSGTIVGTSDSQVLTNKTLTAPTITTPTITSPAIDEVLLTEAAAPSTPASGKLAVYAKTDHQLYIKDSTGTETNIVQNPVRAAFYRSASWNSTTTALSIDFDTSIFDTASACTLGSTIVGLRTSGSPIITGIASTSGVRVGQAITGTGIPTGTRILTIDSSSQITMTANASSGSATSTTITAYFVFITPRTGYYVVEARANSSSGTSNNAVLKIRQNGTTKAQDKAPNTGGPISAVASVLLSLTAGDAVDAQISNGTGSIIMDTGVEDAFINIHLV